MDPVLYAILILVVLIAAAVFPHATLDLGRRLRSLRRGVVAAEEEDFPMVGPYGTRLSHVDPQERPWLVAAGWREERPNLWICGATRPVPGPVRPSPGHRNFGIPRRSVADNLGSGLSGKHPGLVVHDRDAFTCFPECP